MTPIAVVIVNYNTREYLRACLESVCAEAPVETIVVDNASSDGSAEMVRAGYPRVRLYANRRNIGYGAAANQAIAGSTATYVLLLNSDTLLPAGALQALSSYLDRTPRAAVVGPRLVNPDGTLQRSCFRFPGTFWWFVDNDDVSGFFRHLPVLRNRLLRTWSHRCARVVPWIKGAAIAIRKSAFDSVGGFDESFFLYFEETDLCYRLRTAGWETHFAPHPTITHVGEASTAQYRTDMTVQLVASHLRFCHRHYSVLWFAALTGVMTFTVLGRLLRDFIRLRLEREPAKSARIAAHMAAWQRVLLLRWPKATVHN
jgi:GT2 family glycosyltransferase